MTMMVKKRVSAATGYQLGPPPLCPIQHMNRKGKKDEKVSVDARQNVRELTTVWSIN